jgi:hypothetical protein
MNPAFDEILAANDETRAGLFNATAQRLGSTPQNVEKDFWVCWTLDALFNGLSQGGPRLLFKGGTSLSKAHGLISRFSEDIDVVVYRDDLGEGATVAELEALSRTKRLQKLDAIRDACTAYIQGSLLAALNEIAAAATQRVGASAYWLQVQTDPDDAQSLLVRYPAATPSDEYVRAALKIESGAKSALDPHSPHTIRPYVEPDAAGLDLSVDNVVTVEPERTFWDKVVILHGLRRWYERRGELRGGGQRISRHYYDLHRLVASEPGAGAIADADLGADCVAHARMFFNRPDYDLASAAPPTFALSPRGEMVDALRRDYTLMVPMIFGPAPDFGDVLASVAQLEARLNGA